MKRRRRILGKTICQVRGTLATAIRTSLPPSTTLGTSIDSPYFYEILSVSRVKAQIRVQEYAVNDNRGGTYVEKDDKKHHYPLSLVIQRGLFIATRAYDGNVCDNFHQQKHYGRLSYLFRTKTARESARQNGEK